MVRPLPSPIFGGVTSANTSIDTKSGAATPVFAPPAPVETPANTTSNTSWGDGNNDIYQVDWTSFLVLRGEGLKQALRERLPKLDGEPQTDAEIAYVLDAYTNLPSKNMVFEAVWGSKNTLRKVWLDDIVDTYSDEDEDSIDTFGYDLETLN